MTEPLALSIVIPTTEGWPSVAGCLTSVTAAAQRVNAELIVVDGSGRAAPDRSEVGPITTWLGQPGASLFQLRLQGYRAARGAVVAATEDHCVVNLDWAEKVLAAHSEWPEAAAVGGVVENGSTSRLIDQASFFVNVAASIPPGRGRTRGALSHANVSYKREALETVDDNGGMGVLDSLHLSDLQRSGAITYRDDRIRIAHVQSLGIVGTTAAHFHAGRLVAIHPRRLGPGHWTRVIGCFVIPLLHLARITRNGMTKPHRRQLVAAVPWMTWLLYAQAAGRFLGYLTGPGDSPRKVA